MTGQNSRTDRHGGTRKTRRDVDAPAPTVTGQARSWRVEPAAPTPGYSDEELAALAARIERGRRSLPDAVRRPSS